MPTTNSFGEDPLVMLRRLAAMNSTTNADSPDGRAALDAANDDDEEIDPDGVFIRRLQDQEGGRFSRYDLARDARSQIRLQRRERQFDAYAKLQQVLLPAQVKGQYDVAAARTKADADSERLRYTQDNLDRRADERNDQVNGRLDRQFEQQQKLLDDRQAATQAANSAKAGVNVPAPLLTALQKARDAHEGFHPLDSLYRGVTGNKTSSDVNYESALSNVLTRQGSIGYLTQLAQAAKEVGDTFETLVQKAKSEGETFGPNELEFLRMRLAR